MRRPALLATFAPFALLAACSGGDPSAASSAPDLDASSLGDADAGREGSAPAEDAARPADAGDASLEADARPSAECYSSSGAPGQCLSASSCSALADHTPTTACPGATTLACCIDTPDPADNPPFPAGYKLMSQSQVTPEMTNWAVAILHDPVTYRMFDTVTKTFGAVNALARVEWHPPDFQNSVIHRGVTLYEPG